MKDNDMTISSKLIEAVMDRLEYFRDVPLPYGSTYESEMKRG